MSRPGRLAQCVIATLIALATILVRAPQSAAGEHRGISFRETVTIGSEELLLRGMGHVKYLRIFDVYVGALYLPSDVASASVLGTVPKRLELTYQRSLSAEQIVEAGDVFLQRNTDDSEIERLGPSLDKINALYEDVVEGDRYTLTYVPSEGTTLALNGEVLGAIPGDEFARAYYRIWLGRAPVSESFRDGILGVDLEAGRGL